MKKIEKDLIIGVIKSASHKAATIFEKGKMVSEEEFHEILHACNHYEHLFFWIEETNIQFGRELRGNPSVEIILTTDGYRFRSSFLILKPHFKFRNTPPFAQEFKVEEMVDKEDC